MKDALLQSIANRLIAMGNSSGLDEYGYKKVMIPPPHERERALEHINEHGYERVATFHFTDSKVVDKVIELHSTKKSVWIILDTRACQYDLFSHMDRREDVKSTRTSEKTCSEADSQARILRKKQEAERRFRHAQEKTQSLKEESESTKSMNKISVKTEPKQERVGSSSFTACILRPFVAISRKMFGK